jgi:ABC-2 type transport system permease protein
LANKQSLLDARAKDYTLRLLDVKKVEEQQGKWQLINIVLPVLFIVLFAVVYQWWRKKKYTLI